MRAYTATNNPDEIQCATATVGRAASPVETCIR
jgi:hypothetical protein